MNTRGLSEHLSGRCRVSERICSVRECETKVLSRGLCNRHYLKARRRGELLPLEVKGWHRITEPDLEKRVGVCAVCGPDTPIRIRPERGHECQNRRRKDNKGRSRPSDRSRGRRGERIRRYSITVADVERMRTEQGGCCAICRQPTEKLVVDHDHACCPKKKTSCGRCVRGLLCSRCNLTLGWLRDDPQLAIRSAEYLLR